MPSHHSSDRALAASQPKVAAEPWRCQHAEAARIAEQQHLCGFPIDVAGGSGSLTAGHRPPDPAPGV